MAKTNITNTISKTNSSAPKSKKQRATPKFGHTPTTRSADAFPKNAKTNSPGRVPTRNAPHFVWDGTRLLQEYTYKGSYTYIYTDQDSYEPLAQVFDNAKDETQYLAYFHNDQIGIPREMTDIHGNLLWYDEYTAWGRLKKDERVYKDVHQPFRLQNQYYDEETGLHYNLMRYYGPEAGRFVN